MFGLEFDARKTGLARDFEVVNRSFRLGDHGRYPPKTMNAAAHLTFDRDYFELQYDEWLEHRSRFKKYEIWLATAVTVFGIVMTVLFRDQWLVGVLFCCGGIYEFAMSATSKRRWVRARLETARDDKTVDIVFSDGLLTTTSSNGAATMKLSGFVEFTPASDGFFLIPDSGVSIYIPRATISPDDSYSSLLKLLSTTVGTASAASGY